MKRCGIVGMFDMKGSKFSAVATVLATLCIPAPALAADGVEITLRSMESNKGLLGNDVCRLFLTIKNGTAHRINNLQFDLVFPSLPGPAKGGTGLLFLSPGDLGSDSAADFVATWHEGKCRVEHEQAPRLAVNECAIGNLSERDCKALFSFRSEITDAKAGVQPTASSNVIVAVTAREITEQDLTRAIKERLPPFWQLDKIDVTAPTNYGKVAKPEWRRRLTLHFSPMEDLFVRLHRKDAERTDITVVLRSIAKGDSRVGYAVASSRFASGNWTTEINQDNTVIDENAQPLKDFSGRVVVAGSSDEKAAFDEVAAKALLNLKTHSEKKLEELRGTFPVERERLSAEQKASLDNLARSLQQSEEKTEAAKSLREQRRRQAGAEKEAAQRLQQLFDQRSELTTAPSVTVVTPIAPAPPVANTPAAPTPAIASASPVSPAPPVASTTPPAATTPPVSAPVISSIPPAAPATPPGANVPSAMSVIKGQTPDEIAIVKRASAAIQKVIVDDGLIGVEDSVDACYRQALALKTEKSALYCYVLHTVASKWSTEWHRRRGMSPPSYVTEGDVKARINSLFDAMGYDAATRTEKLSTWSKLIVSSASGSSDSSTQTATLGRCEAQPVAAGKFTPPARLTEELIQQRALEYEDGGSRDDAEVARRERVGEILVFLDGTVAVSPTQAVALDALESYGRRCVDVVVYFVGQLPDLPVMSPDILAYAARRDGAQGNVAKFVMARMKKGTSMHFRTDRDGSDLAPFLKERVPLPLVVHSFGDKGYGHKFIAYKFPDDISRLREAVDRTGL